VSLSAPNTANLHNCKRRAEALQLGKVTSVREETDCHRLLDDSIQAARTTSRQGPGAFLVVIKINKWHLGRTPLVPEIRGLQAPWSAVCTAPLPLQGTLLGALYTALSTC
jgi:hypothetical protein